MEPITNETIRQLSLINEGPCLSLYMPTHRHHPDNLRDPIAFKNLVKLLQTSLLQQYSLDYVMHLLTPFEVLAVDEGFWNKTDNGLAVFASDGLFRAFRLPISVSELVVVADSFHTKPIRKYLQSVDRFQVLGLSLQDYQLYEGNRHGITKIDLPPEVPQSITDVLGEELTEEHLTVAAYGGVGANRSNMYHGHGGRKDEVDKDAERFFREVSRIVHEHYSKSSGLPLILAALPEHHNLFQRVNKNPLLLEKGILVNPKSVPEDQFIKQAWEIIEPAYIQRLENLGDDFLLAKSRGAGLDHIEAVAAAAAAGRVDTLLVEIGRLIPGQIVDEKTGYIKQGNLQHPGTDDLLDDISELVVKRGGSVMMLPAEKMPSQTGLAARLRY